MVIRAQNVVHMLLGDIRVPEGRPHAGTPVPVCGTVVRHPEGMVLVDTGLPGPHPEVDPVFRPYRRPLEEALASVDGRLEDVVAVVNCHLHFDHSGGNPRFPGLPIHVQRQELRAARQPDYTLPDVVDFPGATFIEHDGAGEVLPGIRLLPTPGHTAGHQSTIVETDEGTIVLAGQAVYTGAEWAGSTDELESGLDSAVDPVAYGRSIALLKELDPVRVMVGHDPVPWER